MIADLKPYPEYKDSGLPWLGQVPAHWEMMRLKRILRPVDRRSSTGTETLLSLRRDHGVVVYADHFSRPPQGVTTVGFKLVQIGQLVVNRMQANNGLLFHSRLNGLVSPDFSVFEARTPVLMDYLSDLIRSPYYRAHFRRESTGLGTGSAGFLRLYDDRLLNTTVAVPSLEEQTAMVRFLVWVNRRLARAIRAKRKVIALLNEQKQAIVYRAVTGGVDPSVPTKPSGIAWLGDIPVHWDTRKMKFLVSAIGGMTPNKGVARFWDGRVPWVSPKDMKRREIGDSQDHITEAALRETNISLISPPAVLIVVRGMILARTFPTAVATVPLTVNQDMKALIPKPMLNADFLVSLLTGIQRELLNLVEESGHGTRCLRTDSWENLSVPLPPVSEQVRINEQLKSELAGVNGSISRSEREIELLREYRTRLVSDVVTGKLDVRESAAQLPDEFAPGTPEDETAALSIGPEAAEDEADEQSL